MKLGLYCVGERQAREPALLSCQAASSCGVWVTHDFVRLELVAATDHEGRAEPADAEIYICRRCGCPRRWGLSIHTSSRRYPAPRGANGTH